MAVSASILIQYQNAAWKPQKPPKAISTQRKKPPSTGAALDSSVATRACDRPQKSSATTSMSAAAPGPPSRTIASRPNGPDDTNTKIVPASVTTPRPRRSLAGVGAFIDAGTESVDIRHRDSGESRGHLIRTRRQTKRGGPEGPPRYSRRSAGYGQLIGEISTALLRPRPSTVFDPVVFLCPTR